MKVSLGSWDFILSSLKDEHQRAVDTYFKDQVSDTKLIVELKNEGGKSLFLKLNSSVGERGLSLLGSNEKDYHFFGDFFETFDARNLSSVVEEKRIDNIKISLLSLEGASLLQEKFRVALPNFDFHINLNSISPFIKKENLVTLRRSYARQLNLIGNRGWKIEVVNEVPREAVLFHQERWGENRGPDFFNYLNFLNKGGYSRSYILSGNGNVIAYIQNIITSSVSHYYYSIYDQKFPGSGTSVIASMLDNFTNDDALEYFSFGRGAERYKYDWANGVVKNFELRGFLIS
ncbi:MAG TPA: GNAT family N-acetyltransferase [Bacteroidota bacterium]|nr:GNAT family N-acetyltransferase [Bacteroidota bacterium]